MAINQDVFVEKIVARRRRGMDYLIVLATSFGSFGIIFAIFFFFPEFFISYGIVLLAGVVFMAHKLISAQNIEFEYIVTNDDVTIDKIVAKKKRKRVFSGSCKDFTSIASVTNSLFMDNQNQGMKILDYSSSKTSAKNWFFVTKGEKESVMVLFEPDEKILQILRRFNPRAVKQ